MYLRYGNKTLADSNARPLLVNALWDTGASFSVVSTRIVSFYQLPPTGHKVSVGTVGSDEPLTADSYVMTIALPGTYVALQIEMAAMSLDSMGLDLLIGMDFIGQGALQVNPRGLLFQIYTPR